MCKNVVTAVNMNQEELYFAYRLETAFAQIDFCFSKAPFWVRLGFWFYFPQILTFSSGLFFSTFVFVWFAFSWQGHPSLVCILFSLRSSCLLDVLRLRRHSSQEFQREFLFAVCSEVCHSNREDSSDLSFQRSLPLVFIFCYRSPSQNTDYN